MKLITRLDEVCRDAVRCNKCFRNKWVEHTKDKLPQPRWVGPGYETSSKRILLVMLNPGEGSKSDHKSTQRRQKTERKFKNRKCSVGQVFWHQAGGMHSWGRGKFLRFCRDGLGLELFSVALGNIAWCSTKDNKYPQKMLDTCFKAHTQPLIVCLRPDIIILSGNEANNFSERIQSLLPKTKIIRVHHYASWGTMKDKNKELTKARKQIITA